MKLKLTEAQYQALEQYIEEARQEKIPTSLKSLFDDNKGVKFFGVVQRLKTGDDSEYYFELVDENGHIGLKDVNKMGKTKNCVGDLKLDTILYGNQIKIPFGSCGIRTINNVTSVKLYASSEDVTSGKVMDSMDIEHDLDASSSELIDKYYNLLKSVEIDKQIYIDSKNKWDGIVIRKSPTQVEIELYKHGIPLNEADSDMEWNPNTKNKQQKQQKQQIKRKSIILILNIEENPFYEDNGIWLKGISYDRDTEQKNDFVIPIKKFDITVGKTVKPKQQSKGPLDPQTIENEEDIRREAKRAYKMIMSDKNLKDAFYRKPSFWNLFISELKGKAAPGKGIFPTLQLLRGYGVEKMNKKLGLALIQGKRVNFEPYNRPYTINYQDKTFQLDVGKKYTGVVRNYKIGDNFYVIDNKQDYFKLYVKNKTEIEDVYACELIKYTTKDANGVEEFKHQGDVYIRLLKSDGYNPKTIKNTSI